MFTGIIEDVGTVHEIHSGKKGGKELVISTALDVDTLALGDSVAVSGVCLTVVRLEARGFAVDVGPETLERTTIGELVRGRRVNLERALTLEKPLGGHLVSGHVDGVGVVEGLVRRENAVDYDIEAPLELLPLIAARGSITIDGISLTVTRADRRGFSVSIIPHTLAQTTLAERGVGTRVNLEVDVIARYVARLLEMKTGGIDESFLKKHGF
ncbi:MAG: riboflavin synthase [Myxococcota bacterium]